MKNPTLPLAHRRSSRVPRPYLAAPAAFATGLSLLLLAGGCKPEPGAPGSGSGAGGAGAPGSPAAAGGSGGAPGNDRLTIAVIPKGTVHEFWKTVEGGARAEAEELGVDLKWDGPTAETEHDRQRAIVDAMVGLGVDGIALAPTDVKALVRPVRRAVEQGVPVLIYDSELEGDAHFSFVATDNLKGGRLGGEHLAQLLGAGGGKVALLRYTEGSGSTLQREKGFTEAVAAAGGIEIVAQQFTDGSTAGAQSTAINMLNGLVADNRLQLDGVFASNLPTTIGMLKALDRMKKQGIEVRANFVGFDASKNLVEALQAGEIAALVVQNPDKMGRLAVRTLVDKIKGEAVDEFVDTGVELVTRDRLAEPAIRALVGAE